MFFSSPSSGVAPAVLFASFSPGRGIASIGHLLLPQWWFCAGWVFVHLPFPPSSGIAPAVSSKQFNWLDPNCGFAPAGHSFFHTIIAP